MWSLQTPLLSRRTRGVSRPSPIMTALCEPKISVRTSYPNPERRLASIAPSDPDSNLIVDDAGIDIAVFGEDGIDQIGAHGEDFDRFAPHQPANAIEVVNDHVTEETAAGGNVRLMGWVRIAHGVPHDLDLSEIAAFDHLRDFGVGLVEPPLKADLQSGHRLAQRRQWRDRSSPDRARSAFRRRCAFPAAAAASISGACESVDVPMMTASIPMNR